MEDFGLIPGMNDFSSTASAVRPTAVTLESKLEELSRTPILLVASDFDGTLSPIAATPREATPNREAIVALRALAATPQTHAALISGRALRDLAQLSGLSDEVFLIGSHGSEFDPDFAARLDPKLAGLRDQIRASIEAIVGERRGFLIEEKPVSIAFHYRGADANEAAAAVIAVRNGPGRLPGVHLMHGKRVLELSVVPTSKGAALAALRHRVGATAALFIGDDESDESAFATLRGPDVGIKVGDGVSKAEFEIADPLDSARILATLAARREAWVKGGQAVAIERHSMLSDQRTIALVSPEARLVWFCAPRIDSSALFAELLGGAAAGYFSIGPADGRSARSQQYVGETMTLRTEWDGFSVTDFLDCSGGRPFQRAGRSELLRAVQGRGRVAIEFAPRLDFGRHATRLRVVTDGLQIESSVDPVALRSPGVTWKLVDDGPHQRAVAEIEATERPLVLELRFGLSTTQELMLPYERRADQTERFWRQWAEGLRLPSLHRGPVARSALVLKALTYGPTGAIAAAGTTSLPEHLGGVRNWDYRYCWLRDASLSATALARLGSTGVGMRLLEWILGIVDRESAPEHFRPVYTVTGSHLGVEADLRELSGYRGSRPVRVGNAAAQQLQLDVFGPIMELIDVIAEAGVAISTEHWRLTQAIVGAVERRWHEPDHGIWEIRTTPQHHVHSKVMCWLAVDRAMRVARVFTGEEPAEWRALRDLIGSDVLTRGWSASLGAFAATYEHQGVDVASLLIGMSGLLRGDDSRFVSTVSVVERTLRRGPTVYRYLYEDGLPGREGGFHLCTAWLIQALVLVGRVDDARNLFDQMIELLGPTGLGSEEYCPKLRIALGNHPQAYTHLGIINAALAIDRRR